MPRLVWTLSTVMVVLTLCPRAQSSNTQPPRFRGGTDLIQVDVSVLDRKRQPVRGLTAADFTLLEDGLPREIQAFTEVYLPDRERVTAAPWVRDVPSDVVSNQAAQQEGRLVIILLDRTIPVGEPTFTAKRTASTIVDQLGPGDIAAIVSTSGGATHNLTADRRLLLRTINESDVSTGVSPESREIDEAIFTTAPMLLNPLSDGRCLCGLCVLETITRAADAVQGTVNRRKILFFIGSDLTLHSAGRAGIGGWDVGCESRLTDARNALFRALDRANLTVHVLDPSGLSNVGSASRASSTLTGAVAARNMARDIDENLQHQGALGVLPDRTGGRTVINTNAPYAQVSGLFRESDSYYLLGFRPTQPGAKGNAHTIAIKTNRRGLQVHARHSYTASSDPEASPQWPDQHPLSRPLRESLAGLLPSSDVPIDITAAAFAVPGSNKSAVTLTVGVGAFAILRAAPLAAASAKQGVPLEVVASAFDRGGRLKGVARQTLDLSWPSSDTAQERRFDVLSRLDLPPGDYELRVGVSGADPPRTASVFSYISAPAFDSAPLSLSSIVLGATAGTLTAPKDFLAVLLPIVPTARREFAVKEKLVGFLRLYQGTSRRDSLLPVQLRSSVLDAQGRVVAGESSVLDAAQFEKGRTADHYLALPLSGLAAGEYLLRIEAVMGARRAGRAVRFTVR